MLSLLYTERESNLKHNIMLNPSSNNIQVSKSNLYAFTARYRRAVKQETKQRIYNLAALNCTQEDFDLFRDRVA